VADDVGEIFGLALAIAASPFPVIPAILLLFTTRPRATSLAFLGGWLAGIGAVTGAFALLADVVGSSGDSPIWLSWVRVVIGATLVAYGVRQWIARGASDQPPGWMGSIQEATPAKGVRLALLLSVANPKVLLLAAAAGLDIGAAKATAAGVVLTAVLFTMVASISVAVPVLTYAVVGDRVLPPLEKAKDWLTRNNAAVMAVVITVIGLALLKNGLSGL
jgi:threonine/homoserine/homoserine lactone efflux protein